MGCVTMTCLIGNRCTVALITELVIRSSLQSQTQHNVR